jgi:transposase-like protein
LLLPRNLSKSKAVAVLRFYGGAKGTAAKAMLADPHIGVTQIARRLGVSPATLYRYIPAARTANLPGV